MGKLEKSVFKSIINSINIYGLQYSIHYKDKRTFVSSLGIFLSIFSILFFIILLYYYFHKLIFRSSFSILVSNERKISNSIDLNNIPIMISLLNNNASLIEINQNYFDISVWKKTLTPINNSNALISYSRIELEYCNQSIYQNKYPEMKRYDLSKYLCIKPNQNLKIKGRYGDTINVYNSINIYFSVCITEDCLKNNDINELTKILYNSYLSMNYLYDTINHYNYSSPFNKIFRNEVFQISPIVFKKFIYYFSSMKYISDNGILFIKEKKYKSFTFDHLYLDFVGRNNTDSTTTYDNKKFSKIIQISLSCADYSIVYNRNYLKITEIFSNIGGLIDFIFIVCNAITIYFSRKSLIADISNNLVFNGDNKNENERKISKFVIFNDSSKINFGNTSNKELIYSENRKFNINVNDIKHIPNNEQIINNKKQVITKHDLLNNNNSFYIKYLKNSNLKNLHSQKLKISFLDYFLPYFILKKYKNYELLCVYHNIMHSYLSLEQLLPSIERCRKLFQSGNPFLTKINENNIFSFRKINLEKNNFFSIISTNPNHLN